MMFDFSELTFILGPNGAGKSTLLKSLARIISSKQSLYLDPSLQKCLTTPEQFIYLPSHNQIQFGVTGHDLLELFEVKSSPYYLPKTMSRLGADKLLHKPLNELSSGEAQRVCLSATLSHRSPCVLLDEPLTHLDWSYGFMLEQIINEMRFSKRGFIISCHDLNWTLLFPKARTLVLFNGRVIADEAIETALTHSKVQEVFNFKSLVTQNPLNHANLLALAQRD